MTSPEPNFIAIIPARATRNGKGGQYYPVFNVFKTAIQEDVGVKLSEGALYHIVGDVEGAFDFDIHRIVKTHFRMVTPLEHRDKVVLGEVYNLRIRLFEQVRLNTKQLEFARSAVGLQYRSLMYRLSHFAKQDQTEIDAANDVETHQTPEKHLRAERVIHLAAAFSPTIRLQSGRDCRLYFRVKRSSFRQRTGLDIKEGEFYRVGGRIEGVGSFQKTLRSLAARQDIPFYIPKHLRRHLEVGKSCTVVIDRIERLLKSDDWLSGSQMEIEGWTWKEIASWVDTEGTIHTGRFARYLSVAQKEKPVIQEIRAFLKREGVVSSLRLDKHTGVYYVMVSRVEHIATVIRNIEPFIRTENKKREVSAFKEELAMHRDRLRTSVIQARNILGIKQA